jgi:hypothetical protein
MVTRQHAESPWPAVTVHLFIDAAPAEAAALFTDYESHQSYIPDVKHSRVSRVVSRSVVEVDYVLDVPLVSDEHYTVRNHLVAAPNGGYRVTWRLVRATSTKGIDGFALFVPYTNARNRKVGTLMTYYDFVIPGSRLASLAFVKDRAIRQVGKAALAIARRTESERKRESTMRGRLASLHAAIASSPPEDE